jgi:hypothetical protein
MQKPDGGKDDAADASRGAVGTSPLADASSTPQRPAHCNAVARARRPPEWLIAEVEIGIGLLLAANLPGAPGRKQAADLVDCWAKFIVKRGRPDHAGFARIRAAFAHVAGTARSWPKVKTVVAAILPPPYVPPAPLPTGTRSRAGDAALAKAAAILGVPGPGEGR